MHPAHLSTLWAVSRFVRHPDGLEAETKLWTVGPALDIFRSVLSWERPPGAEVWITLREVVE